MVSDDPSPGQCDTAMESKADTLTLDQSFTGRKAGSDHVSFNSEGTVGRISARRRVTPSQSPGWG